MRRAVGLCGQCWRAGHRHGTIESGQSLQQKAFRPEQPAYFICAAAAAHGHDSLFSIHYCLSRV